MFEQDMYYAGVTFNRYNGKWAARLLDEGMSLSLGYFNTEVTHCKAFCSRPSTDRCSRAQRRALRAAAERAAFRQGEAVAASNIYQDAKW